MSFESLIKQLDTVEKKLAFFQEKKIKGGLSLDQEFRLEEDIEDLKQEIIRIKKTQTSNNKDPFYEVVYKKVKNIISWIIHIITTVVLGLGFMALFFVGASVFVNNFRGCNPEPDIDINQLEKTQKKVLAHSPNLDLYKFKGFDKKGKKVEYITYFLKNYNWALGEVATSENEGQKINICNYLNQIGIINKMNDDNVIAVITLGNASNEESLSIPLYLRTSHEEDRAEERANKLANCLTPVMSNLTPLFTLNLGKYEENDVHSLLQRRIIVIGVLKQDDNAVQEEALLNGLILEEDNLGFNVLNYSKVRKSRKLKLVREL
jgi:hypothetical protein